MKAVEAVANLCNTILNTFHPDLQGVMGALPLYGLKAEEEVNGTEESVAKCAISLCKGYVEGSRSENGVSSSVMSEEAMKRALRHWCRELGLDEDEVLGDTLIIIEDYTHRM